jgi:hypothetical protein
MNPLTGCPCRRRRSEELHSAPELAGGTIQSGMMRAMLLRGSNRRLRSCVGSQRADALV